METKRKNEFFQEMNLSKSEIETFEKYVSIIEKAQKNSVEFINTDVLAFTPGALLVVAVAKFAYDVYQDYGAVAVDPREFQMHFKGIIKELNELENMDLDSPSLDIYTRLRKDLILAKKDFRITKK